MRVGHRLLNIVCSSKDIADVEIKTGSFTAARFQNIHLTRGMNPHIIKVYGTICLIVLQMQRMRAFDRQCHRTCINVNNSCVNNISCIGAGACQYNNICHYLFPVRIRL